MPGGVDSLIFRVASERFSFHRCRLPLAVLGDYSLYRGWIISLQWSAPNRLSHWFSQSPGISSGKLASSEDSHGSRQARSADYGDSFTKFHFPRIPKARFYHDGACLTRIFATLLLYNSRTRTCLSLFSSSPKSFISFNLLNNTMICRETIRSFIQRDREFFVELPKFPQSCSHELLLFDITAVSAGFQLNGLLAKRG